MLHFLFQFLLLHLFYSVQSEYELKIQLVFGTGKAASETVFLFYINSWLFSNTPRMTLCLSDCPSCLVYLRRRRISSPKRLTYKERIFGSAQSQCLIYRPSKDRRVNNVTLYSTTTHMTVNSDTKRACL